MHNCKKALREKWDKKRNSLLSLGCCTRNQNYELLTPSHPTFTTGWGDTTVVLWTSPGSISDHTLITSDMSFSIYHQYTDILTYLRITELFRLKVSSPTPWPEHIAGQWTICCPPRSSGPFMQDFGFFSPRRPLTTFYVHIHILFPPVSQKAMVAGAAPRSGRQGHFPFSCWEMPFTAPAARQHIETPKQNQAMIVNYPVSASHCRWGTCRSTTHMASPIHWAKMLLQGLRPLVFIL